MKQSKFEIGDIVKILPHREQCYSYTIEQSGGFGIILSKKYLRGYRQWQYEIKTLPLTEERYGSWKTTMLEGRLENFYEF